MSQEEENKGKMAGDLDGDGKISKREREYYFDKIEDNQKMAWIAFGTVLASGFYLLVLAPETRIAAYGTTLDWFFIALLSIIGFHYGVQGFANKK